MWIRSQNKEYLLKVNCLFIQKNCHNYNLRTDYEIVAYDKNILGTYSTKAKALKVLDILETFIRGDFVTLLDGNYIKKLRDSFMWGMHDAQQFIREMQNQVFQMPQDSEVE